MNRAPEEAKKFVAGPLGPANGEGLVGVNSLGRKIIDAHHPGETTGCQWLVDYASVEVPYWRMKCAAVTHFSAGAVRV